MIVHSFSWSRWLAIAAAAAAVSACGGFKSPPVVSSSSISPSSSSSFSSSPSSSAASSSSSSSSSSGAATGNIAAGRATFSSVCAGCHSDNLDGSFGEPVLFSAQDFRYAERYQNYSESLEGLTSFISEYMPFTNPARCVEDCARDTAAYIWSYRGDSNGSSYSSSSSSASSSEPATGSVFPDTVTRPRIMIVGDSASAGPGCYKKYLDESLRDSGITNYEFVGEYSDDCGGGIRHSAVSCSSTTDFTQSSFTLPNCFQARTFPGLSQLMPRHNPDMVLLQLGVNDVWRGDTPVQGVLNNYSTLVQQMRSHNPDVVVVVAQIHKIITDNCTNQAAYQNAQSLIEAVPAWAESLSSPDSPIFVADLWTNSDPQEADDCVHPNEVGARRMGGNWYAALAELLR